MNLGVCVCVCGILQLLKDVELLDTCTYDLSILEQPGMGVTRMSHGSLSEEITKMKGPVMDRKCKYM